MNRTELIKHVTQDFRDEKGDLHGFVTKKLHGNTVWTVWEKPGPDGEPIRYIAEIELLNPDQNEDWRFEKRLETDPPTKITCPEKFLQMSSPLCEEWRKDVRERLDKIKKIKEKIKKHFKDRGDQTLRVILKPDPGHYLNVPYLDIISSIPLEGRHDQNGRKYAVPCRWVSEMFYLTDDHVDTGGFCLSADRL